MQPERRSKRLRKSVQGGGIQKEGHHAGWQTWRWSCYFRKPENDGHGRRTRREARARTDIWHVMSRLTRHGAVKGRWVWATNTIINFHGSRHLRTARPTAPSPALLLPCFFRHRPSLLVRSAALLAFPYICNPHALFLLFLARPYLPRPCSIRGTPSDRD